MVSSLCQAGVLALAACQAAGTGSAHTLDPQHILESPGALALDLGSLFDLAQPGGDVLQSSHLRQRFQRGV